MESPLRVVIFAGGDEEAREQALGELEDIEFIYPERFPLSLESAAKLGPDALLMPYRHGDQPELLQFAKSIKKELSVPLICLLDSKDVASRSDIMDIDCDDFVLRPYRPEELRARILRATRHREIRRVMVWGNLSLDEDGYRVVANGKYVDVTHTEFQILKHLLSKGGRVMKPEELYQEIWKSDFSSGLRTVYVHIRRLRAKLQAHDCNYIGSVRGVGYRLVEPDEQGKTQTAPALLIK